MEPMGNHDIKITRGVRYISNGSSFHFFPWRVQDKGPASFVPIPWVRV